MQIQTICVFCGSEFGASRGYADAAVNLGNILAQKKINLVYGGGKVGLMGKIADTVLAKGGAVTGVIPEALEKREVAHHGLTKLLIVNSMHERKAKMAELSDAFIAMPGGFGTFEEFCEVVTWTKLGIQNKPCGLLNVDGYYDSFLNLFERALSDGFVKSEHQRIVVVDTDPLSLLQKLREWQPMKTEAWLCPSQS